MARHWSPLCEFILREEKAFFLLDCYDLQQGIMSDPVAFLAVCPDKLTYGGARQKPAVAAITNWSRWTYG